MFLFYFSSVPHPNLTPLKNLSLSPPAFKSIFCLLRPHFCLSSSVILSQVVTGFPAETPDESARTGFTTAARSVSASPSTWSGITKQESEEEEFIPLGSETFPPEWLQIQELEVDLRRETCSICGRFKPPVPSHFSSEPSQIVSINFPRTKERAKRHVYATKLFKESQ